MSILIRNVMMGALALAGVVFVLWTLFRSTQTEHKTKEHHG